MLARAETGVCQLGKFWSAVWVGWVVEMVQSEDSETAVMAALEERLWKPALIALTAVSAGSLA